jgi:hypothetical protein
LSYGLQYKIFKDNCRIQTSGWFLLPENKFSSPFIEYFINNFDKNKLENYESMKLLSDYVLDGEYFNKFAFQILNNLIKKDKSLGVELNTNMSLVFYRLNKHLKNKETSRANILLDSVFKVLPLKFDDAYGWIGANALILAQHGDTTRAIKLLNYVQSAEEKNKILLNICYQLQDGPGIEYTYFYLNELLRNYSKDAKIGMALYRVLGKIGGYEAEKNQARQKYRNTPELMKPKALQNWVLGTAENGNYYKAKQLIPENVSETKELILMNQILSTEIIKQSKKSNENAWQGHWNDTRYFDLDLFPGRNNNDFQFSSLE